MADSGAVDVDGTAPAGSHQRVGWFELFYDLVIVAAVGHGSHVFVEDPTWGMGTWLAVTFLIMFLLWLLTVLNNNLFPGDHPWRRLLVLLQMLALVVASLSIGRGEGLPDTAGFVALAVAFGSISAMYLLAMRSHPQSRHDARLIAWSTGAGALILLAGPPWPEPPAEGAFNPVPWLLAIGLAVASLPLLTVFLTRLCRSGAIDDEHLGERIGQLVIIVLGESFVSLVTTLGGRPDIPNPVFFVLTFAVVFAIWTIYFSSVVPAGVPGDVGRLRVWLAMHWLLMFGAVGAASGFAALAVVSFSDLDQGSAAAWTPVPLLEVMIALTVLTWLSRHRRLVVVHLASCLVLAALVVVRLTVSQDGTSWEVAVGALVVVADAVISVRVERPYRRVGVLGGG